MSVPEIALSPLRVVAAEPAAEGIQAFTLARDDGGALAPFTAGAHLHVKAPNGLVRRYSLCNDPAETDRYQFAVKREAEGSGLDPPAPRVIRF